jgi:hypothetical protein
MVPALDVHGRYRVPTEARKESRDRAVFRRVGRFCAGRRARLHGRFLDQWFEVEGSARWQGRTFNVVDVTEIYVHWYAGRSKSELAASLGVDRKTIRKYLAPAEAAGMTPGGPPMGGGLGGADQVAGSLSSPTGGCGR